MAKDKRKKKCEVCNKKYTPVEYQYDRQKYCSVRCKWKKQSAIEKKSGVFKGGYSRETHIRLWVDAMGVADVSVPCHYCQVALYPDNFVIEHKKPRRELTSKEEIKDITNLVVACHPCNKEKGIMSYEEFKCLKN